MIIQKFFLGINHSLYHCALTYLCVYKLIEVLQKTSTTLYKIIQFKWLYSICMIENVTYFTWDYLFIDALFKTLGKRLHRQFTYTWLSIKNVFFFGNWSILTSSVTCFVKLSLYWRFVTGLGKKYKYQFTYTKISHRNFLTLCTNVMYSV